MQKIGILGGTFNPIHNGHVKLAIEAHEYLKLDETLLIPSGYSYMKNATEIADAKNRLDMVSEAFRDYPSITVSDLEIRRKGPSYTCETIKQLGETYSDSAFYFIIGADTLYHMEGWKEPDYLFRRLTIVVKIRDEIFEVTSMDQTSLKKQADYLHTKYAAEIIFLPGQLVNISSRLIRQRIKNYESIIEMVPATVAEYITDKNLYR